MSDTETLSGDRFRKRPVEVEAVQFIKPWKRATAFCPSLVLVKGDHGVIAWGYLDTLEGRMRANVGDWIVRGVQGEFYPVRHDIFTQTYEAVDA